MVDARAIDADAVWTEETRDVGALRAFLLEDKERGAYFLADLDPRYFHATRWFVERSEDAIQAVVLRYDGHSIPAVLLLGAPDAVLRILGDFRERLPERFEIHAFAEHRALLEGRFPDIKLREFYRMRLLAADVKALPERDPDVQRLTHADTADLMQLYSRTGISYFDPFQIETGLYFGIRRDGALVSAAGVHGVSEEDKVAAIGNVATHPDWRGLGLSTRCTKRLLRALLRRRVSTIVLNVAAKNETAVRLYRALDFREHTRVYMGRVGDPDPLPFGR